MKTRPAGVPTTCTNCMIICWQPGSAKAAASLPLTVWPFVRVIASTHRNLEEDVRQGRFRADLYYRLAVARVRLPPLRTRREDLPVLAQALSQTMRASVTLTPQTLALFEGFIAP